MASRSRPRLISAVERPQALAHLSREPMRNLFLIELVDHVARPGAPGEVAPQVVATWRSSGDAPDAEISALVALRPSLVLDASMDPMQLDAFVPVIDSMPTGLVKSPENLVSVLWERLESRGRYAVIDRLETAYRIGPGDVEPAPIPAGATVREARTADLAFLVDAARASLREEKRPDPFDGDPKGFRRWVRGRLHRARVVDVADRVVFVGYADVRRAEGWLIQGVYTLPEYRRRGMAAAGMAALVVEAFSAGAEHVQLAVVDGNEPGENLYRRLGFEPFDALRTILFA